ncbi:RNA polymerase sigma factor [Mycobacterium sp. LTG2003]
MRSLCGHGTEREDGINRLFGVLVRVARREVRRRAARTPVTGRELDDIAEQAAADALLAVLAKLVSFRGESRFTTWAYRFVALEVSEKLNRHHWRVPMAALSDEDWTRIPNRTLVDPASYAEGLELLTVIKQAIEQTMTQHQRRLFVAVVVDETPLDVLVDELGISRNAIHKAIFDARRKLHHCLAANGYLPQAN